MITSVLRHPSSSEFLIRRKWLVELFQPEPKADDKKDKSSLAETCAEIVSVLEWHTNSPFHNQMLNDLIRSARRKHGRHLRDFGSWLPYSYGYFQEMLLGGRGRNQIIDALEYLEERKFVSTDVPADIRKFYSASLKWYRLNTELLNQYADAIQAGNRDFNPHSDVIFVDGQGEPVATSVAAEKAERKKRVSKEKQIVELANNLCEYHRHVFGKNKAYLYGTKRMGAVKARLKEELEARGIGDFAQGILGLSKSEYMNENGYEDIYYVFRHEMAFARNIRQAESSGITSEIALKDFEGFLSGTASRYTLKAKKAVTGQGNAKETAVKEHSKEDFDRYRKFARLIVVHFVNGETAARVADMVAIDEDLSAFGEGLTDAGYLEWHLIESSKLMTNFLTEKVKSEMKAFCADHAEFQTINSTDV